jgi:hypothetical protein
MQNSKEKVPKRGVRPSASVLILMAVAATTLMTLSSFLPLAYAQGTPRVNPGSPPDPNCWGEINSGLAQSSGGVGEHASDPIPGDDDRETPRAGVGNQAEDSPGEHAQTVGPRFGQECEAGPSSQN